MTYELWLEILLLMLSWEFDLSPATSEFTPIMWVHLPSPCSASGKYPVQTIQRRIVLQPIMSSLLLSEEPLILKSSFRSPTNQSSPPIRKSLIEVNSIAVQMLPAFLKKRLEPIHFNPEVCYAFTSSSYSIIIVRLLTCTTCYVVQVFMTEIKDSASDGTTLSIHIEAVPKIAHHTTELKRIIVDIKWKTREKGRIHYKSVNRLIILIFHELYPLVSSQNRRRQYIISRLLLPKKGVELITLLTRLSNLVPLPNDLVHKIIRDETLIKPADLREVMEYQMKPILVNGFKVCILLNTVRANHIDMICIEQRFSVTNEDEHSMTVWIESAFKAIVGLPSPTPYSAELFMIFKQGKGWISYQAVNDIIIKIFDYHYSAQRGSTGRAGT